MKIIAFVAILGAVTASCYDDQLCAFCATENICKKCWYSYPDPTGACRPSLPTVQNCVTYSPDGNCSGCIYGYYVTADNKCEKIALENCALFNPEKKCLGCANGKALQTNGLCASESCPFENCVICGQNACAKCATGYVLDENDRCIKTPANFEGCIKISEGSCIECSFPTHNVGRFCKLRSSTDPTAFAHGDIFQDVADKAREECLKMFTPEECSASMLSIFVVALALIFALIPSK